QGRRVAGGWRRGAASRKIRPMGDGGVAYLTPEAKARVEIDRMLSATGWAVQDARAVNLTAARGVAVREFRLKPPHGRADYLLFVGGAADGVIEAKKEGETLTGVEWQSAKYVGDESLEDMENPPAARRDGAGDRRGPGGGARRVRRGRALARATAGVAARLFRSCKSVQTGVRGGLPSTRRASSRARPRRGSRPRARLRLGSTRAADAAPSERHVSRG